MRVSLAVPETTIDIERNKRGVLDAIHEAVKQKPDLIVLPETVLTGYQDLGIPAHDRGLCERVNGSYLTRVSALARKNGVMISIGFFEENGGLIHDSSVLYGTRGEVLQHYRRVDPHWRIRGVNPGIYRCGEEVALASTAHGSFSTLICGDLFNDAVLAKARALHPDYLLYPLAACAEDGYTWEGAVRGYYVDRLVELETHTLMVNLLRCGPGWPDGEGDGRGDEVGGACVVDPTGSVLHSLPTGAPGILTCDLQPEVV